MAELNVNKAEFIKSAAAPADFIRDALPNIVFAVKSNVGKSSVINRLLNRKNFARVGQSPGKTIHVNYFLIDQKVYFVDLPGYGYAKRPPEDKARWSELTDGYFTNNPSRDRIMLVLQLVDMRVGLTADDKMMLEWLTASGVPFAVAATKADKLQSKKARAEAMDKILSCPAIPQGISVIPFSSVNGEGKDELWRLITGAAGK